MVTSDSLKGITIASQEDLIQQSGEDLMGGGHNAQSEEDLVQHSGWGS